MTEFTFDGLKITPQDLSVISPNSEDDDRLYHHNGSNEIHLTGGSTTARRGFYLWDADAGAWFPSFHNADLLDGKEAGAFLHRDGSLAMEADLDVGNYGIINVGEVSGGTGGAHFNTNHVELHSHTTGANLRLIDANGLLVAEGQEGGDFDVPNGSLYENGSRVATRAWANEVGTVANAEYAENANNLDGYDQSSFLHVSGDQMEGVFDAGGNNIEDGGTVVWNTTTGLIPQSNLEGPASSLSSYPLPAGDLAENYVLTSRLPLPAGDLAENYVQTSRLPLPAGDLLEDYALTSRFPIPNTDIANTDVTVNAGNQLTGGGTVNLGGSVNIAVDESTLNAAKLDGYDGSDLAALAENESVTGTWTFNSTPSVPASSWSSAEVDYASVPLSIPVTKWANGLSNEEIWRIELQAGESIEVHRLEIQPKGGGDVTGLEVELYDVTNTTVLASTSDVSTGSPISSSGGGSTIVLRISNSSGNSQNASIGGQLHLV